MTIYRHKISGPGPSGDLWTTTLHTSGAANLATTHAAWTTFVNSFVGTTLVTFWPAAQSATSIVTDQLDAITGKNVAQQASAISLVGTGTGATSSPRVSLVASLRTTVPTRAGRGRMYWPAPSSVHYTSGGLLLSADATTIANAMGTAFTTMKTTAAPIIWHNALKTFDLVTYVAVGVVLGTQKRRTNKIQNSYSTKTV